MSFSVSFLSSLLFLVVTYFTFSFSLLSDCKFTLLQDSGTFQTPNFPVKYPNNIECVWNIQVQPGRFILLSFDVVELESYRGECIDLVEVKDGSRSTDQLLGSFCDISLVPKVITSSSNTLRIWFYSDKSDAYQGFNGSYISQWEKGCGGALTKHSQSISSPRYPDYPYPNSIQCDWVITMPRGKFIRLEFSDFEVEFNCDGKCWCTDQLEIWEGPEFNDTKLGSFCVSVQELIVSKTNRIRLRFTTNKEGRFKGFFLSYTSSITPGESFSVKSGI
ncbi:tolloid-like protein 2 [Orbicella faveolata]|uniref:tolloid-like protein 2 n=1 Tax=Orbicella faveolata TaxID=48498 RepID=UPI0009E22198|nr:tolloid-like protein 2 [Orbicella faveolata]